MMTSIEQVTEFVAHYTPPLGDWGTTRPNWNSHALDAWLEAARQRGIEATVLEICEGHEVVGMVAVGGHHFAVTHLGRRMELQAVAR
ncbi:hypothetical protein [Nocardia africana]